WSAYPHQRAFVTPVIRPSLAMLRKQIRQMPNLRYTARGRPHSRQRKRTRMRSRAAISLRGSRCAGSGLRISALWASSFFIPRTDLTYCASVDISLLRAERHAEGTQQLPRLIVVIGVG